MSGSLGLLKVLMADSRVGCRKEDKMTLLVGSPRYSCTLRVQTAPDSGHGQPLGRGAPGEKQKTVLSSDFLASSKGILRTTTLGSLPL